MSNLADFSPYKRSYQFIHLQNSAYHLRNKKAAKPIVNTNIRPNNSNKYLSSLGRSKSKISSTDYRSRSPDPKSAREDKAKPVCYEFR